MEMNTLEFSLKATADQGIVEGYATSYGNYIEKYNMVHQLGMFAVSIAALMPKGKIKLCWNHDEDVLLGVIQELREDEKGLFIRAKLSIGGKVPIADEKWELVKAGAINTFSVRYEPLKKVATNHAEFGHVDTITEARLVEVSLVSFEGDKHAEITNILDGAESTNFDQNHAKTSISEDMGALRSALYDTMDALWEEWGKDSSYDLVGKADAALATYHAKTLQLISDVTSGISLPPMPDSDEPQPAVAFKGLKASELAETTSLTADQATTLLKGMWPAGLSKETVLAALPGKKSEVIALRQKTFNELCNMLQDSMEPAESTRLSALMNQSAPQTRQEPDAVLNAVRKLNERLTVTVKE